MTAAPALMLPGSRTLLGWWRELADLHPRRFWFARLLLHRLEALTRVARPRPLDPLPRALLRSAALAAANGSAPPWEHLHLDRPLLSRWLSELAGAGLLHGSGDRWELSAEGRRALAEGTFVAHAEERRTFYFLDNAAQQRSPHFLALDRPPSEPLPGAEGGPFDLKELEACIRRPSEWKARFRFPAEVEAVVAAEPGAAPDWRTVALDRPEQLATVLVQVPGEGVGLLGYAVRTEGWVLERAHPVLALEEGATEVFPELAADPPLEAWLQAWHGWCQPRNLPSAEVRACVLKRADHRLIVQAPPKLIDRLRSTRSDAVKGEAWLLAGGGRTWSAAQIDVVPAG